MKSPTVELWGRRLAVQRAGQVTCNVEYRTAEGAARRSAGHGGIRRTYFRGGCFVCIRLAGAVDDDQVA
jgi:hypothetical protein